MDRAGLLLELKALHPGRGIRRPRVRSWLGPQLLAALDADPTSSDAELRSRLASLLGRHADGLPRDLRALFRLATALDSDLPGLEQRAALLGQRLQRSNRVLRRMLRDAEELVADSMAAAGQRGPTEPDPGWRWTGKEAFVALGEDAVITVTRSVGALSDYRSYVDDVVGVPWLRPEEEIEVRAVEGLVVVDTERLGVGSWRVSYALARELRRDEELVTVVRVRVPRARALAPFFVLSNRWPAPSVRVTVDLGEPRVATHAWVLDGISTAEAMMFNPPVPPPSEWLSERVVSREFVGTQLNHGYGFGWRWAD